MTTSTNTKTSSNSNAKLTSARKAARDEFYTRLEDIENELKHYRHHFRDKTIFLNCDDPEYSNFWFYFSRNFDFFGLKRLISTHYTGLGSDNPPPSYVLELQRSSDGSPTDIENPVRIDLEGDGDFRSDESIELLKQSDIVVTNPPFSLSREYIAQLMEYEKKFLIIGNPNMITYKDIWPHIQDNKMWLGMTANGGERWFKVPDDYESRNVKVDENGDRLIGVAIRWYTNLENKRRSEDIILFRHYEGNEEQYPKYDNYDAIEVSRVVDIPLDYEGYMGVPITFLGKHNPDQFEIVDANLIRHEGMREKPHGLIKDKDSAINGKPKYARIVIKRV